MSKPLIKTYSTETFREAYMKPEEKLNVILKPGFGKFFITKVEDMIRLIKLPVPPTRSTTHSFIYLTSGEAVMTIGSETYTIYKDECLFVPATQVYSFDNVDINKGYLCNFHNSFIAGKIGKKEPVKDFDFLQVWGNPKIQLSKQSSTHVNQLLKRIMLEYSSAGLMNEDIIRSNFLATLFEIKGSYNPASANKQKQSLIITNKFKELLFANIKTKHLATDYATLLNITPNHLNKAVKEITGRSVIKWINEVLMMEAKVLLYQTELSVSEVAAEIGLLDQSYFSRIFKQHAKQSPLQFRKMIEKSK